MRPALHDLPARHNRDPIHRANGRKPVSDDDRRAASFELLHRLQKLRLGPRVQRAGRFIHDQHWRILEKRAGDGNSLPLPSREAHSALAKLRVIAKGQFHDELVRSCGPGRRLDLLRARPAQAIGNILGNRRAKQHRLLEHQGDVLPQ